MEASVRPGPSGIESANQPKSVTGYSWYVVGVLVVLNIFSWLDRQVIVMLIDPIRDDLGISEVQISLLTGFAFAVLYAFCGIPLGLAADKFRRRVIIFCGVCFWSLATIACGFARNFWQLFAGRVGVGVGEAALIPASYSILSDTFPPRRLGLASALLASASTVGIGLSFTIAGFIASSVGHGELLTLPLLGSFHAWQVAFIVVGLPGPFLALLIFTIKEPERGGLLRKTLSPSSEPTPPAPGFFHYLRDHRHFYFFHFSAMTSANVIYFGTVNWAPSYLTRVFDWSPLEVGAVFGALLGVGILSGQVCGGSLVDFCYARGMKDAHLRIYAFAALLVLPVYVGSILAHDPVIFLGGVVLVNFIMLGNSGAGLAAMQFMTPNEYRGRLLGMFMFIANFVGLGLGPLLVAMLTQYLFHDDKSVGDSLMIVALCLYPLTSFLFWKGAKHMREIHTRRGGLAL